jgi:hypothetical protein
MIVLMTVFMSWCVEDCTDVLTCWCVDGYWCVMCWCVDLYLWSLFMITAWGGYRNRSSWVPNQVRKDYPWAFSSGRANLTQPDIRWYQTTWRVLRACPAFSSHTENLTSGRNSKILNHQRNLVSILSICTMRISPPLFYDHGTACRMQQTWRDVCVDWEACCCQPGMYVRLCLSLAEVKQQMELKTEMPNTRKKAANLEKSVRSTEPNDANSSEWNSKAKGPFLWLTLLSFLWNNAVEARCIVVDLENRECVGRSRRFSTELFKSLCKNKKVRPLDCFYSSLTSVKLGLNLSFTYIKLANLPRFNPIGGQTFDEKFNFFEFGPTSGQTWVWLRFNRRLDHLHRSLTSNGDFVIRHIFEL